MTQIGEAPKGSASKEGALGSGYNPSRENSQDGDDAQELDEGESFGRLGQTGRSHNVGYVNILQRLHARMD